ncbi:hypothetical protein DO374_13245 [Salmonella enterica]|uniref:Trimeric autotransporter adhesin YadA-like C-terminal membrane anchor domain-containing protein n=1 Tax=Salmonella enterica TaxID=28901 RepID=A0A5U0QNL0_SALER|nr:hypothetical protein [Salmonella enterica]
MRYVIATQMKQRVFMKATNIKLAVLAAVVSFNVHSAPVVSPNGTSVGSAKINNTILNNVSLKNVVTTDDGIELSGQTITGLKDGKEGTDAVTVNQLNGKADTDASNIKKESWHTTLGTGKAEQGNTELVNGDAVYQAADKAEKNANNYTDASSKSTLKKANNYTDNRFEHFGTQISNDVLEKSYSYTERRSVAAENNAVRRANTYTDSKFGQLNTKIEQAEKRFNAGIAGVTAIASIPYVAENTFSYGLAVGNYRNGNALAGGVQYKTSPNTNVRLNVSWDSSGNAALGAGLAGGW